VARSLGRMGFVALGLTIAAFGVILGGFVWLGARMRRRGIGGSPMGPFEEMWDPATYHSNVEIQVQVERRTPPPSPGDPPMM
jgi:hypothetical protein